MECSLMQFTDETTLGKKPVNMLEGRAAIHRNKDRLEKWDTRNPMKYSKDKSRVLPLGQTNLLQ